MIVGCVLLCYCALLVFKLCVSFGVVVMLRFVVVVDGRAGNGRHHARATHIAGLHPREPCGTHTSTLCLIKHVACSV